MKKLISILLAIAMLAALCACGSGGNGSEAEPEAVKGETQEWGNLSVFVPEGNSLVGGSLIDAEDPDSAWILLDSDNTHYYLIGVVAGQEDAEDGIIATKEINEVNGGAGDVTVEAGGVSWTGYAYISSGIDCFMLCGQVAGGWVTVTSAYHTYNSAETIAILESIKVL